MRDILLVASLYDSFTLSEGKHLTELIFGTYHNLSLSCIAAHHARLHPWSGARAARRAALRRRHHDVAGGRHAGVRVRPGRQGRARPDLPVFLLAYTMEELRAQEGGPIAIPGIDRSFLWRGDVRLFLTIIKLVEDQLNAEHDTRAAGVRIIILVEDSVPFYSSYLPMLLTELVKQTASLITEEVNLGPAHAAAPAAPEDLAGHDLRGRRGRCTNAIATTCCA